MNEIQTDYGKVYILSQDQIFQHIVQIIEDLSAQETRPITVGLTGGSTPKEFYKWAVANHSFKPHLLNEITWMTSDERYLPLTSDDSNFGNADRLMLSPLGVLPHNKHPWKVNLPPQQAAEDYNKYFIHDKDNCFDLCILGMGDDCHMASIFPNSPLIESNQSESFAAIDVPGKGIRLTIIPTGLKRSKQILMIVTGKGKSQALKAVLKDDYNANNKPAQLNKLWSEKVIWLVDHEAASELS